VKVSLKYVPIKMSLDPSESINNMGKLRLDILDGQDLPSADSNGKSDPYCKFELNGNEIFKTKVQKKTLSPTWNEFFELDVPSRTGAELVAKVYDYDFADKPDFLGAAKIDLASLDPFKASESKLALDGKSGSIRVRMLFRPDYVRRSRQGTSAFAGTFGGPGRIVTGVAGAPIKGGVAVAGVVGSGVGKGATFLRRGIFGKKDDDDVAESPLPTIVANGDSPSRASTSRTPQGTQSPSERPTTSNGHARTKSFGASSTRSGIQGAPGSGTASLTIVGASGYPPSADLYIMITQLAPKEKTIGKTKHYKSSDGKWNFDDTFHAKCTPDTQFKIEVKGEHLLGSDDALGEHIYFVDESGSGYAKELAVGSGIVTIRSSFQPAESSNLSSESPRSHVRRSFLSKRDTVRHSREVTPNP
jgi:hypothetical protein